MTRIVLNDFAGHAFTLDLADGLHAAGFDVRYAYCSSNVTPHADFDEADVPVRSIGSGATFEKYGVARRLIAEIRYGLGSAIHIVRNRPDVVIANNMPLGSLAIIWIAARLCRAQYVVWLQDLTSGLVAGVLGGRSVVARLTSFTERFVLRRADRLIAISEHLAEESRSFGVSADRITVLPNWPALRLLPLAQRNNPWARAHGLGERPVVLYSGTLAKKHSPEHLVALARALPAVDVVVITEGEGATVIDDARERDRLDNLRRLPYQAFHDLHDVLGTADLLVVLLNPSASRYSVPSKVMSYLCSGRAILGAMPEDNDAARIIAETAGSGVIVDPADVAAIVDAARTLLDDPERLALLGERGREYADREFGRDAVVERFLAAADIPGAWARRRRFGRTR